MTDPANSTDDTAEKQSTPETVAEAPFKFPVIPPKDYDTDLIEDFLDTVFHAGLGEEENILTWMVKPYSQPFHPKGEAKLVDLLKATRQPKALYYATATCKPCPEDGKLHHRKSLFQSLRVVVLDDIGTKIPTDRIPEDFPPSYIIESSKGNHQYGYILAEPVDSLPAAEALIQLVYEGGYSDEGGKTPVKLVRLPEGVNGKKGVKGEFVSRLVSMTDTVYTPQEILDHLNLNVRWGEVLKDADDVTKRRASKSLGSTPWANITPQAQAMNGYIDPVLEYLYETDQVALDNQGVWVDIKCPWCDGHTTGGSTARYAPLGRGDNVDMRGFKCFHDNCAAQTTVDFLKYIAGVSGIEAGVNDPSAQLTTKYVFDKGMNAAWDIKSDRRDMCIAMQSFSNLYPHKTRVQLIDGKEKFVRMTHLWVTSPTRVTVAGATYDPSTTARIVHKDGEKFVNLFSTPDWGHGTIDDAHVKRFTGFLKYLIPEEASRDYFLMWLAAKCQDMSFRGAAIVMVANKQGVGRSTLADMIKTLMGEFNVADVPLPDMVGGSQFNEWQEKPFIVSEETLSGDPKLQFNTYEKLKTFIDPRSRTITINPKYGLKRQAATHASYLFLSNHINAIAIPPEDRRFFVLENATTPASPAFFTKLNAWLGEEDKDGLPLWGRHIYRWLQEIPVNMQTLTAPPVASQAKKAMTNAALSDLDFAVSKLLEIWPDPYINPPEVFAVLAKPVLAGPLGFDDETSKKFIRRAVMAASHNYACAPIFNRLTGVKSRPRVLTTALEDGTGITPPTSTKTEVLNNLRDKLQDHYRTRNIDSGVLADTIVRALQEDDRI